MKRRVIPFECMPGLIRAQMSLLTECDGCVSGPVKWRRSDGDACNWMLSKVQDSGSPNGLDRLAPLLVDLRRHFDVPEPRMHAATVKRSRAIRVEALPGATERMKTDELLDTAQAAVRGSRMALLKLQATRSDTRDRCRRSCDSVATRWRSSSSDAPDPRRDRSSLRPDRAAVEPDDYRRRTPSGSTTAPMSAMDAGLVGCASNPDASSRSRKSVARERDGHDRRVRGSAAGLLDQIVAVHARHPDVGDQQVERPFGEPVERRAIARIGRTRSGLIEDALIVAAGLAIVAFSVGRRRRR